MSISFSASRSPIEPRGPHCLAHCCAMGRAPTRRHAAGGCGCVRGQGGGTAQVEGSRGLVPSQEEGGSVAHARRGSHLRTRAGQRQPRDRRTAPRGTHAAHAPQAAGDSRAPACWPPLTFFTFLEVARVPYLMRQRPTSS